jgi:hypothetical protein
MKKAKKWPSLLVLTEFGGRCESNFWYSPNLAALEQNPSMLCAAVDDLLTKGCTGAAVETEGNTMATTSIYSRFGEWSKRRENLGTYTNEEMLAGAGEPAHVQRTKIGAMNLLMESKNAWKRQRSPGEHITSVVDDYKCYVQLHQNVTANAVLSRMMVLQDAWFQVAFIHQLSAVNISHIH